MSAGESFGCDTCRWLGSPCSQHDVSDPSLVALRAENARLKPANVQETPDKLTWRFTHGCEIASSGGTVEQRWQGLFTQTEYLVDDLARKLRKADAELTALRSQITQVEQEMRKETDNGTTNDNRTPCAEYLYDQIWEDGDLCKHCRWPESDHRIRKWADTLASLRNEQKTGASHE